jgi:hypothetical protein
MNRLATFTVSRATTGYSQRFAIDGEA